MDVLNQNVRKTVEETGIDYYHFTENEQRGLGFGERFSNSVQDVFNKGYTSVICLGNDTPLLTAQLINAAAIALNKGKAVKGKSFDGGLYLIGLQKDNFDVAAFKALPWQSSLLAIAFHDFIAAQNLELKVLQPLADIDTQEDLENFLAGKDARNRLIRLLISTLLHKLNIYKLYTHQTVSISLKQHLNKGSPVAA